ncbi:MAG: protoheme IX farnesyltransferase [Chloroflexi bacterium]|nr:protoheme IX farnesyltransferase [Chloroflexota bacterium]
MMIASPPLVRSAVPGTAWTRAGRWTRLVLTVGKVRVVGLVTFTALVATVVAAEGHPSLGSMLAVLAVGALAGGGAGALNHVLDRDLDRQMRRTCQRPLVTGQARVRGVALAATVSLAAGLGIAYWTAPALALHTVVAAVTYVLVYSRLLKRHTSHSVVIGGWTGAAAVLAGWEATGQALTLTALALAAVVFAWTPAHFWGLAVARVDEYRAAGIPALPVVAGIRFAVLAIVVSAALTLGAAVLPLVDGQLGVVYGVGLAIATVLYGPTIWRLVQHASVERAWRSYKASGLFLLVVFLGALVDSLL